MAHGGGIIALVFGMFSVILSVQTFINDLFTLHVFFVLLLPFLVGVCAYVVERTLLWGYLAYGVLNVRLYANNYWNEETIISQLHERTWKLLKEKHPILRYFKSAGKPRAFIIPIAVMLLCIFCEFIICHIRFIIVYAYM